MAFLLDSNVVSELWKPFPSTNVVSWISSAEWLTPVVVIAEIQEGAEAAPTTARRTEINRRLDAFLQESGMLTVDWDADTAAPGRGSGTRMRSSNNPSRSGTA
ncbi:MAG: hypothetical protein WCH98_03040 [Verrucomicrobiota bacterium]